MLWNDEKGKKTTRKEQHVYNSMTTNSRPYVRKYIQAFQMDSSVLQCVPKKKNAIHIQNHSHWYTESVIGNWSSSNSHDFIYHLSQQ